MKVLYLLDSINRGGIEILALDICHNAAAGGVELTLVAMGGGHLEEEFRNSGINFIQLKRHLPIDFNVVWRLRQIIKKNSINIIHAHQAVDGIHAYLAVLGTDVKLVLSFHGFVADKKNYYILNFLTPRVAKNVFVSDALLRYHIEEVFLKPMENSLVIHNGVDERRLATARTSLCAELKIPNDAFIIGMIGNFYVSPRKDQMTLVKALLLILKKSKNAHCIFVGRIENGAEMKIAECINFTREHKISDRVHFLGLRSDVPAILNRLDVFVLSSLHEGLPIAVLEAMLANVPCVLSDIRPNLEVSRNGQLAQMFPVGNSEILAEKVLQLAENETIRFEFRKKAIDFASCNYSISAHIGKLKELYQSLI